MANFDILIYREEKEAKHMKVGLAHSPPMIENAVNEWWRYLDLLVSPVYHFTVAEVVVEGKIGRHDFRLVTPGPRQSLK